MSPVVEKASRLALGRRSSPGALGREPLGSAQKGTLPNHPEKGNHKQKYDFALYRGTTSQTSSMWNCSVTPVDDYGVRS